MQTYLQVLREKLQQCGIRELRLKNIFIKVILEKCFEKKIHDVVCNREESTSSENKRK